MKNKTKGSYRDRLSSEFQTERWSSLFRCAQFIRKNYTLYQKVENEEDTNSLSRIEDLIGWENLEKILQIMWILIEKVEKDLWCICDIVPSYLIAIRSLSNIRIKCSQRMSEGIKKDFLIHFL